MNASFTEKPTSHEKWAAGRISVKGQKLVAEYASEINNGHEWNNEENIQNTKTRLLAYIAELEDQ